MKRFLFAVLFLAAVHLGFAQTNLTEATSPAAPANAAAETSDIHAKYSTFDLETHLATYMTNVVFNNPRMKLKCAWLTADEPPNDKYSSRHIIAITNVVMDLAGGTNGTWHVTCNQAVYDFKVVDAKTNEVVTLTGNAQAESEKYIATGEPLTYDMQTKKFGGVDYNMIFKHPLQLRGNTNAPGAGTNSGITVPSF